MLRKHLLQNAGMRVFIAIGVFHSMDIFGQGPSHAGEVVFVTKVSELGLADSPLTRGKQKDDKVKVVLQGSLIIPARKELPVSKEAADWSSPEKAAISDYSANVADDLDWILKGWVAEEREKIKGMMANEQIRTRKRAAHADSKGFLIHGVVYHGEYAIILAKHDVERASLGLPIAFKKTGEGWKKTNALAGNEVMGVVFSAFNRGKISQK